MSDMSSQEITESDTAASVFETVLVSVSAVPESFAAFQADVIPPVLPERVVAAAPVVAEPVDIAAPPANAADDGELCFLDLPLPGEVLEAVQMSGYLKPTEIQAQIIPHMLEGRDVLAQSQTGTGKTAAFALPILSRIEMKRRLPQVLVLAPTRELAIQVATSFETYGQCMKGLSVATIYGGQDYSAQFKQLKRGVHVVVGTPGRVIDHIKRGTLDLSGIECLVLDEADEMLNMGFLDDVQFVLSRAPESRQIALFSATLPAPIRDIAQQYLNDPAKITIKTKTMTAESIRQRALFLHPRDKVDVLTRFLEVEETDGVIIFTKTKDGTVELAEQLQRRGLSAVALNGDMPQKVRERTIEQLKGGRLNILVATDVAARGLDVTRVSHVFNYDLPQDSESYIHRVGRTGRAGRKGEAIIFLTNAQRGRLRGIEYTTKQTIEIVDPPTADEVNAQRVKAFTQKIADTTEKLDLTQFQELIGKYSDESETPMVLIAAALAQIAQNGRPFFVKDYPKRAPRQQSGPRTPREHTSSSERRPSAPPAGGMTRYRIEVGWRDGAKPGNIVGAVANEGGINGRDIGAIRIQDAYSTIDLPSGVSTEVLEILKTTRVAGKSLQLKVATAVDLEFEPRSSEPRNRKPFNGNRPTQGKPFNDAKRRKRKSRTK